MKVLVDECVDWRLSRDIVGHEVKTARQMGWSTVKNGELLALAATEFDVLEWTKGAVVEYFSVPERRKQFDQRPFGHS